MQTLPPHKGLQSSLPHVYTWEWRGRLSEADGGPLAAGRQTPLRVLISVGLLLQKHTSDINHYLEMRRKGTECLHWPLLKMLAVDEFKVPSERGVSSLMRSPEFSG